MNSPSLAVLANPQGTTGIDAGWRELAKGRSCWHSQYFCPAQKSEPTEVQEGSGGILNGRVLLLNKVQVEL